MNNTQRNYKHAKNHLTKLKKMHDMDGKSQIVIDVAVSPNSNKKIPLSFGALAHDIEPLWQEILKLAEKSVEFWKARLEKEVEEMQNELNTNK